MIALVNLAFINIEFCKIMLQFAPKFAFCQTREVPHLDIFYLNSDIYFYGMGLAPHIKVLAVVEWTQD